MCILRSYQIILLYLLADATTHKGAKLRSSGFNSFPIRSSLSLFAPIPTPITREDQVKYSDFIQVEIVVLSVLSDLNL